MVKKWMYLGYILISLSWLWGEKPTQAQETTAPEPQIFVQGVYVEFPRITLQVRALDENNRPVESLSSSELALYEDRNLISPFTVKDSTAPTHTIFILDVGRYANFASLSSTLGLQAMLKDFVATGRDYFREGIDTVELRARTTQQGRDETITLISSTSDSRFFQTQVEELDLTATGVTQVLESIREVVSEAKRDITYHNGSVSVVLITPHLDDVVPYPATQNARAEVYAQDASTHNIRIHTIDTSGRFPEPLQRLSSISGGETAQIDLDNYSISMVRSIFGEIRNQRNVYMLSYDSSARQSGTIEVMVIPNNRAIESVKISERTTYSLDLTAPRIILRTDKTLIKRLDIDPNEDIVFDVNFVRMGADIEWVDGSVSRTLQSVILRLLDSESDTTREIPVQIFNLAVLEGGLETFSFDWDVTDFDVVGNYPLLLNLVVQDNLGITYMSESVSVVILVEIYPVMPSPPKIPKQGEGPTPTPQRTSAGVCRDFECWQETILQYLPWTVAIIVLLLLVITQRRSTRFVKNVIDKTLLVKRTPLVLARLAVVDGPPHLVGKEVKLHDTTVKLGRDPKLVHHTFYDQETHSTVSREHCTIVYDQGEFRVIDNRSANGTWINGMRLVHQSYALREGDTIILGVLGKQGVKLVFHQASNHDDITKTIAPTDIVVKKSGANHRRHHAREHLKELETPLRKGIDDSAGFRRGSLKGRETTLVENPLEEQSAYDIEMEESIDDTMRESYESDLEDTKLENRHNALASDNVVLKRLNDIYEVRDDNKLRPPNADDKDDDWRRDLRGR